jgi:Fe2+ or Zn2+ uptake regulation protein
MFPEDQELYSVRDILTAVRLRHPEISRSGIYRALAALRRSPSRRELVMPVESTEKRCLYDFTAARLIAFEAARSRHWKKRMMIPQKTPSESQISRN